MANGETYDIYFSRFTAKEAGIYMVAAELTWKSVADGKHFAVIIYKNGVRVSQSYAHSGSTGYYALSVLASESLEANDYIELYAAHWAGGTLSIEFAEWGSFMAIGKIA